MKKPKKKTIIRVSGALAMLLIGYGIYYFFFFGWLGKCGFNDGPFKGRIIELKQVADSARSFALTEDGNLYIDNRHDTLSPIITLVQNGEIVWTIDTDLRNTPKYSKYRLWKINDVVVDQDSDPIRLSFTSHWSYGWEYGSMEIKRKNGKNSFCLSW